MFRKKRKYTAYIEKNKGKKNFLFGIAVFAFLCAAFWLIHNFAIGMFRTESAAMEPALSQGECFIASPFYFLSGSLSDESKRGDIVLIQFADEKRLSFPLNLVETVVSFVTFQQMRLFSSRDSWGSLPVVRRLLGLPGDTVYMDDFVLYIKPVSSEHFLTEFELLPDGGDYSIISSPSPENWQDSLPFSGHFDPVELKEGEFFVISDNRVAVNDSRTWGAVKAENIKGKVLFRYWPPSKIGAVR